MLSLINTVHELRPGTYQRTVRFAQEGSYDLQIGLSEKEPTLHFTLNVVPPKADKPWVITPIMPPTPYVAGQSAVMQYRVTNKHTGAAEEQIEDAVITVYSVAPGQAPWQQILQATHVGDGVYQVPVTFPRAGTFSTTFSSLERGLTPQDAAPGTVEVVEP